MKIKELSVKAFWVLITVGAAYRSRLEMLREICKVAQYLSDSQIEALSSVASSDIVGIINAIIKIFQG